MLAVHTPSPTLPVIRNEMIEELWKKHQYEVVTFPAYWTDEMCMNKLRNITDPNTILFIALMKGITPIVTIGDHKSFIADFNKIKEKKTTRSLPKYLRPSYSNTEKAEKHLRGRRGSA